MPMGSGPCSDFGYLKSANDGVNINAAKRTESNNLADKKVLHHLSQIVFDYT